MHTDKALVECKTVLKGNKQLTVREGYLKGFLKEAAMKDLVPILHVVIGTQRWLMIPEADFDESQLL